jgi:hypothetical protein
MSYDQPQNEEAPRFIEQQAHIETSNPSFRLGVLIVALVAVIALFVYAVHERGAAKQLAAENQQINAALKSTQAEMNALSAKLDSLVSAQQEPARERTSHVTRARAVVRHGKPDPRWVKFQHQLDAQGKEIDQTRADLASTRGDLESTKTELSGSIARTHDELVVLQKKGERNYYEFDLTKSKQFSKAGPFGISLRKANTKHQYADLELLVDDRQVSQKHLNLYQPAMFYPDEEHQPLELVINSISKNHIHGYISAPKYRASELTAMANNPTQDQAAVTEAPATAAPQLRRR